MNELLEQAIDALRRLPPETQDAFARLLLEVLAGGLAYQLSAEDRAVIETSREQARRGEFVPAAEMEAFWAGWSGTETGKEA